MPAENERCAADTARAGDQEQLARLKLGVRDQKPPNSHVNPRQCRGFLETQARRYRKTIFRRESHVFGIGAVPVRTKDGASGAQMLAFGHACIAAAAADEAIEANRVTDFEIVDRVADPDDGASA